MARGLRAGSRFTAPFLWALLAALTARADYPGTVTNLNPVGYWRLNEPAATIASLITGTATNYGTFGSAGDGAYVAVTDVGVKSSSVAGDTAPYFNPPGFVDTEYVEIPNTPELLTNTSMSIECWVLRTNFSGSGAAICGGLDTSAGALNDYLGFELFLDNAASGTRNYYLRVRCSTGGNGTDFANLNYNARLFGLPAGTPLGLWDHVVYAWDQTNLYAYINGLAMTNNVFPAGKWYHPSTNQPIRIAVDSKTTPGTIAKETQLAHVAFYPYVLSYDQVTNHLAVTNDAATYKAAILADNPVGYWPLNEPGPLSPPSLSPVTCTNLGSWGSAADGVLSADGSFNTGASGVPYTGFGGATCAEFTGGGSQVVIPPQTLATNEFTITAWHKLPGNTGSGAYLNNPDANNCIFGFGSGSSAGMVSNQLAVSLTGAAPSGTTPAVYMPSNEWAFVAWVVSPGESVVYVNGAASTNSVTGTHDFGVTNLLLGDALTGSLADVALFDRALTPAEISTLYAAAEIPATTTTVQVATMPGGNLTVSGTAGRGQTAVLYKSTNLLEAAWTEEGAVNADSVTGEFIFFINVGTNAEAFYRIE